MSAKTSYRRAAGSTRQAVEISDMGLAAWRVFDDNGVGHVVWTLGGAPEGPWARVEPADG